MMNNPTGAWMKKQTNDVTAVIANEDLGVAARASANPPRPPTDEAIDTKAMAILWKKWKVAEREIQLLRDEMHLLWREIKMIREMQQLTIREPSTLQNMVVHSNQYAAVTISLESIKPMLNYFDGTSKKFDAWQKQLELLRTMNRLDDNATKLLAISRLENRALEWFHSKPEHVEMRIDDLMKGLRDIFGHRQDRTAARREFNEEGERETQRRNNMPRWRDERNQQSDDNTSDEEYNLQKIKATSVMRKAKKEGKKNNDNDDENGGENEKVVDGGEKGSNSDNENCNENKKIIIKRAHSKLFGITYNRFHIID